MIRHRRRGLRPRFDALDGRLLPAAGLSPALVRHAYGVDAIAFSAQGRTVAGDGSGQAIAIVGAFHDPNLASDLHAFDVAYGLKDPVLSQVDLAGSATDDGWAGEESLDVEWAHAIAPGATIVAVEAASDSVPDLTAAIGRAKGLPGVSVVSMSWGGDEMPDETAYDPVFTTPAGHGGITFLASSGDDGLAAGAQWPSSSSNVVAVGGTTLAVDGSGTNLGETLWSGSGGGNSLYEAEPAYQEGFQSSGRRGAPDVAFDGDPQTGVGIYVTAPSTGQSRWEIVGGTSLGAPAWAGIIAEADQGLALAGKGSLDGASQTLPALYALPATAFHAVPGRAAGLGTPVGPNLVAGLVYGTATPPVTVTPPAGGTPVTPPAVPTPPWMPVIWWPGPGGGPVRTNPPAAPPVVTTPPVVVVGQPGGTSATGDGGSGGTDGANVSWGGVATPPWLGGAATPTTPTKGSAHGRRVPVSRRRGAAHRPHNAAHRSTAHRARAAAVMMGPGVGPAAPGVATAIDLALEDRTTGPHSAS